MGRINNSLRNIKYAFVGQFLSLLIGFINRRIFVYTLATEYLGIQGLFLNILSMLSLAEMGIGTAILYCLYKPLAANDQEKIKAYMAFYKKAYTLVGIFVLAIGFLLMPFLSYIVGELPNIDNIYFIYALYVINSGVSYFWVYKRSLIIADQKRYIYTKYHYVFHVVMNIVQIIFLYITHSFIVYLLLMVAATIGENIAISVKCDRLYPYIKEKQFTPLDRLERNGILKNVRAMLFHKVGDVVVNGTDNILIARFCGVVAVGFYSNYIMIRASLNTFLTLFFQSITASYGNLINEVDNDEKKLSTFNVINLLSAWVIGFSSICMFILFDPFIKIWLGNQYLLKKTTVAFIVINFYLTGMRQPLGVVRNVTGLFWHDRYKAIVESIVNLIASIILGLRYGMLGVLIGTTISSIFVSIVIEAYVVYKHCFHKNVIRYFVRYGVNFLITIIAFCATNVACHFITDGGVDKFVIKIIACIIISNAVFFIFFYKTKEFRTLIEIAKNKLVGEKA